MRALLVTDSRSPSELSLRAAQKLRAQGHVLRFTWTKPPTSFAHPFAAVEALAEDSRSPDPFAEGHAAVDHIAWARWPDLVLMVGASAALVSRLSHGRGEDFVELIALATRAPLVIVTDIPEAVAAHPAVVENLNRLEQNGAKIYSTDFFVAKFDELLESWATRTSAHSQKPSAANGLLT